MDGSDARRRVVVEGVQPEIDCGRFAIKRVVGDRVTVEADVFADGHDALTSVLAWRRDAPAPPGTWTETPMEKLGKDRLEKLGNDRWQASFTVEEQGRYLYTVRGWIDRFGSSRRGFPTSPAWASTSSTSPPSIPSAPVTAREGTTPRWPPRRIRAARGPSAPRREATRPSTPSSAPWRTSTGSSLRRSGSGWRS